MKRLVTILALCALPVAAQAANTVDWSYETDAVLLRSLRRTCAAIYTPNKQLDAEQHAALCWMKIAQDESDALHEARMSLIHCSTGWGSDEALKEKQCAPIKQYIKQRWGF